MIGIPMNKHRATTEKQLSSKDSSRSDGNQRLVKSRPIPRKGHHKSRLGCSSCKRRKVKCDEATPKCCVCIRLGLDCMYDKKVQNSDEKPPQKLQMARTLSIDPSWFSISDIRFFQHFIFTAYPSLPLDNGETWQGISQMSYDYEFLVHAMLCLGASHLNLILKGKYEKEAIIHRIAAIEGLNKFLSDVHQSPHHADAAFGASLILTIQSTHMTEGMNEYLTMIRGCSLLGTQVLPGAGASRFREIERRAHVENVQQIISPTSPFLQFTSGMVEEFCASANKLTPMCQSIEELEFLALLLRVAREMLKDPIQSHHEHTKLYDIIGTMNAIAFASFINPTNYPAQLLIMHFLVISHVMGTSIIEQHTRIQANRLRNASELNNLTPLLWIESMANSLPIEYADYGVWPLTFARQFGLCHYSSKDDSANISLLL